MASLIMAATIAQIHHPASLEEQIQALKLLRNDITGHQQRKEAWVAAGVLTPVVDAAIWRPPNKREGGSAACDSKIHMLALEENVRLEALSIIGSFASGGSELIGQLYAASALPAVLSNVHPSSNPSNLVLASLRVLRALANSSLLSIEPCPPNLMTLADTLFSEVHSPTLLHILRQSPNAKNLDVQVSYTASLVSTLCRNDRHRNNLMGAGVLDALAGVLATVVVSQGMAIPRPGLHSHVERLLRESPMVQPDMVDASSILQALAVIVGDSKLRAQALITSPILSGLFQCTPFTSTSINPSHEPTRSRNVIDQLNPQTLERQAYEAASLSDAFPPLGVDPDHFSGNGWAAASNPNAHPDHFEFSSGCSTPTSISDAESPIIAYLIWMTRSSEGTLRLMSAYLLVVLYKAGLAARYREAEIALLVVPPLVSLLDETNYGPPPFSERLRMKCWTLEELTPIVLGMLIVDSERLQKAAFEAGAIQKLSKVFRSSYEPITADWEGEPWSPELVTSDGALTSLVAADADFSPLLLQKIKVREGVLKALAALTPFKEEYRKLLVDQGVMSIIVQSLKAEPGNQSEKDNELDEGVAANEQPKSQGKKTRIYGVNPVPVLAAACATVRHLSRSPSILRTTLVDSGIVMPIFELLHHPNIEVQIAATAAVCNIVTEMSPMRQTISDAGVLKVLCKHAQSDNADMRYNALWALKHFVQSAGNDTKKSCLRELGQDWLIRLISGDVENEDSWVDAVAMTSTDKDTEMVMGSLDDDDAYLSFEAESDLHTSSQTAERDLQNRPTPLADHAHHPSKDADEARQAANDDTRVQEQGLEFLRNLIGGFTSTGNAGNADMITYLFEEFGEAEIFEVLTSKLRKKVHHSSPTEYDGVRGARRHSPPRPEILTAIGFILVNIAGSIPRHRQAVTRQTELLSLLRDQAGHPVKDVRLAFCWLVINLTWVDNDDDKADCAERVKQLLSLDLMSKLKLFVEDSNLDVRERAKTAIYQMTSQIDTQK